MGAVGGAGTTRACLEFGSVLAHDGRSVAILDAAYATQGLSTHISGSIPQDMTALVLEEKPLASGFIDIVSPEESAEETGRLACCPARAPFERLARAKTPEAAQRFEDRITEGMRSFDHVLVDTPPIAANQAIGAVTGVDRVAIVAPASQRGTDGIAHTCERLTDVGISTFWTVRTNVTDETIGADGHLPSPGGSNGRPPTTLDGNDPFTVAVTDAIETVLGTELGIEWQTSGRFSLRRN